MAEEFPKRLIRECDTATASAAGAGDIKFGPVPLGEQWHVTQVCGRDENNALTHLRLIIKSGETEYSIYDHGATAANLCRGRRIAMWLRENEEFILRFEGATADDDLFACLLGYIREYGEGVFGRE